MKNEELSRKAAEHLRNWGAGGRAGMQEMLVAFAEELLAVPAQGASIVHEAKFLLDRLQEFDPGDFDAERDFHGHVAPAIARLRNALSTLPSTKSAPTPEQVETACAAYAKATGYYVEFHRGLSSESSDRMRLGMRAALAALSSTGLPAPAPHAEVRVTEMTDRFYQKDKWTEDRGGK